MTTESRIDAANVEMAAIADRKGDEDKRSRLRAIWQPIVFELIDKSFSGSDRGHGQMRSNPNFVGVTCDTGRPVFLERRTSESGFVYRKFIVVDGQIAH